MTFYPAVQQFLKPRRYEARSTVVPPDLPLAGMDISIGLIYILSPHSRISDTNLLIAKRFFSPITNSEITSIRIWGILYILVGLAVLFSLIQRRQSVISIVRVGGSALFAMWSVMYLLSAISDNLASVVGVPVFMYLSYRHSFAPTYSVLLRDSGEISVSNRP